MFIGFTLRRQAPNVFRVFPKCLVDVVNCFEDSLVLEADSSPSGGPVVKWFLHKLE